MSQKLPSIASRPRLDSYRRSWRSLVHTSDLLATEIGLLSLERGTSVSSPDSHIFRGRGWGSTSLVNRIGMKPTFVGSMILITVSALLTQISVAEGYLGILPGMMLWVLGASLSFTALSMAALAGTKPGEEGLQVRGSAL